MFRRGPRPISPTSPVRAPAAAWMKIPDDSDSARRCRLLVSEIKLYHEAAVIAGRRERDLATRLGTEIARARVLQRQRVAASVRRAPTTSRRSSCERSPTAMRISSGRRREARTVPRLALAITAGGRRPSAGAAGRSRRSGPIERTPLLPTNHPPLPRDLSRLWMVPGGVAPPGRVARCIVSAVKLEVGGEYEGVADTLAVFGPARTPRPLCGVPQGSRRASPRTSRCRTRHVPDAADERARRISHGGRGAARGGMR